MRETKFPVIAKLRRGSASSNVFLLRGHRRAKRVLKKSFGRGFSLYNLQSKYGDRFRKANGILPRLALLAKYGYRAFAPPQYAKYLGREKGYLLLQEFVPNDGFDIRVVVVRDRLVSVKRRTRRNDFRASGSGLVEYPDEALRKEFRNLAFRTQHLLDVPAMGFDFMEDPEGRVYLLEMSYGFPSENFLDGASGYWTPEGDFVRSRIQLQEWMMEWVIERVLEKMRAPDS